MRCMEDSPPDTEPGTTIMVEPRLAAWETVGKDTFDEVTRVVRNSSPELHGDVCG